MKELHMSELNDDIRLRCRDVAEKAVPLYVQDLLTVDSLAWKVLDEWQERRIGDDQPSHSVLMRIARRICSRELCIAWRSPDREVRNCAFNNLRCYLECSLRYSRYPAWLQPQTAILEDILHQTLETLHHELVRGDSYEQAGPDDPASFLKWAQTILFRQAQVFLQKSKRDACVSLDTPLEPLADCYVDISSDPMEYVLLQELQQTLGTVILSMHNPRYRQVLIYSYIVGLDEHELASYMHVSVQEIYLWRHRALKALRAKPEIMEVLRSLLE
jgi:DNA-directed RNA polymerase specialized sigma24 family protein